MNLLLHLIAYKKIVDVSLQITFSPNPTEDVSGLWFEPGPTGSSLWLNPVQPVQSKSCSFQDQCKQFRQEKMGIPIPKCL